MLHTHTRSNTHAYMHTHTQNNAQLNFIIYIYIVALLLVVKHNQTYVKETQFNTLGTGMMILIIESYMLCT